MANADLRLETGGADPIPRIAPGHEGSASVNLSGRAVLSAWILSIAVHAALFLIMVALVFPHSGKSEVEVPTGRAQIIGPIDAMSFSPSRLPDLSNRIEKKTPTEIRFTPERFTELSELGRSKKPELVIIGIGTGGGDFAKYGLSVGDVAPPEFFGLGSSARGARKVIYVVDISGSMIDTFVYVQSELKRSVSALRRSQKFHVIFFNSGAPLENPPKRLVNAIDAHKHQFFEFLDGVGCRGDTQPEAALRRALSLRPDLVYLLSDGIDFPRNLFQLLDEWNEDRLVRIYTIAYLDQAGRDVLERIAREHNGEFKFVSENDLP